MSWDEALDTLSQSTCYKVRKDYENDFVARFVMSRVAGSDLFRKMYMGMWERQDEEYGWAIEFPESDAYMAFDISERQPRQARPRRKGAPFARASRCERLRDGGSPQNPPPN